MVRTLLALLFALMLSACADLPAWPWPVPPSGAESSASGSRYSFAWRLSGDRAVAPLQVFDDGKRTWLQFAPGQPVPAIFRQDASGDRPLAYTREGPYLVLAAVWPRLVLRGGQLRSMAEKLDEQGSASEPPGSTVHLPATPTPVADRGHASGSQTIVQEPAVSLPPMQTATAPGLVQAPAHMPERADPGDAAPSTQMLTAASFELAAQGAPVFEVSPKDDTLRAALARWARIAGWTFDVEHWAVDADIPIVGSARFDASFKSAVQQLVAATELADRPLQPCFYSNQVLRIVPYAQSCDRTAGPPGLPS
ncbi:TrbG/VirB9 family P-type conjugative transfer protein [Parapusillimonas sp. SGNA-6]|nr:TrbG/VirB9 family P-type conjugative transfer protein [Parapusillimonas sp. SGNA-6]